MDLDICQPIPVHAFEDAALGDAVHRLTVVQCRLMQRLMQVLPSPTVGSDSEVRFAVAVIVTCLFLLLGMSFRGGGAR